jgi:hypothetical protein
MKRLLVEIVGQYAIFLQEVSESELSLETVVRHQEDLAAKLQRLTPDERHEFITLLAQIANGLSANEDREILRRLPDDAGIR